MSGWRRRISGSASSHPAPLVISARDDGFGTYAAAQYTASRIPGAKFVGFGHGGHLLVGHDAKVQAHIVKLLAEARMQRSFSATDGQ